MRTSTIILSSALFAGSAGMASAEWITAQQLCQEGNKVMCGEPFTYVQTSVAPTIKGQIMAAYFPSGKRRPTRFRLQVIATDPDPVNKNKCWQTIEISARSIKDNPPRWHLARFRTC